MPFRRRGARGGRGGGQVGTRYVTSRRAQSTTHPLRGTRGRGRGSTIRTRSAGSGKAVFPTSQGITKSRLPASRGKGRGRSTPTPRGVTTRRGRGGRRTEMSKRSTPQKKGPSGAKLDKDLEDYFKSDPTFSEKKLDTEMDEYWAHRPAEEGVMDVDAAT